MPDGGDINDADKGGSEPQLDAGRSLEIHRIACEFATGNNVLWRCNKYTRLCRGSLFSHRVQVHLFHRISPTKTMIREPARQCSDHPNADTICVLCRLQLDHDATIRFMTAVTLGTVISVTTGRLDQVAQPSRQLMEGPRFPLHPSKLTVWSWYVKSSLYLYSAESLGTVTQLMSRRDPSNENLIS